MTWWSACYVDELSSDFTCVLVDPPGMGGSGTPHRVEAYSLDAIAGDVLALADALGLDRFAVWGQSAGAAVGFVLATAPRKHGGPGGDPNAAARLARLPRGPVRRRVKSASRGPARCDLRRRRLPKRVIRLRKKQRHHRMGFP